MEGLTGVCDSVSKCLPCKRKDLSSAPQHPHKMPDVVVYYPSAGRWREENPWNSLASQSRLNGELQANERSFPKEVGSASLVLDLWSPHVQTHTRALIPSPLHTKERKNNFYCC